MLSLQFSCRLYLTEYVFKHALLCHHKIYIITQHERILLSCGTGCWKKNGEHLILAFPSPSFMAKLLEKITKT